MSKNLQEIKAARESMAMGDRGQQQVQENSMKNALKEAAESFLLALVLGISRNATKVGYSEQGKDRKDEMRERKRGSICTYKREQAWAEW